MTLRQKIYLTLSSSILLIFLVVALIITPLINQIRDINLDSIKKQSSIQKTTEDWLNLKTSKKELAKIDLIKINRPLLDQEKTLDFILILEKIAQQTNLQQEIKAFSLSAPITKEQPNLPFQISLWGGFSQLKQFLLLFENMPYYTEISSMQIRRLDEKSIASEKMPNLTPGDIKAVINIKVYIK